VWGREVDGKILSFHLAGINNENFLMRDAETGSYWQQVSGKAISGPLKGKQLAFVHWDEISFEIWADENPRGTVLAPVGKYQDQYAAKDWESKMKKRPSIIDTTKTGLAPRELIIGIATPSGDRAYKYEKLITQKLVQDNVGGEAILLVVGLDGRSVRGFFAGVPGLNKTSDYYRKEELGGGLFVDSETATEWNFEGCALSGELKGSCLAPLRIVKDYWFDWQRYHPQTTVAAH